MRIDVVSIFPEMFDAILDYGITARALDRKLIEVGLWNPRDFTQDAHRSVDDRPYGGGPGMVMRVEPVTEAIRAARKLHEGEVRTVYLSPQGRRLDQPAMEQIADGAGLIMLAGRYEGIDERIVELEIDEEWSIGDYVLAGGELAAMVIIEAVVRLLPGALGNGASAQADSFSRPPHGDEKLGYGLLDCSHYTRPESFEGYVVPQELLSGNHEQIRQWRLQQSLLRTLRRRPEIVETLMQNDGLDEESRSILEKLMAQDGASDGSHE